MARKSRNLIAMNGEEMLDSLPKLNSFKVSILTLKFRKNSIKNCLV